MEIGGALAEAGGTSKGDAGAGEKGADFERAKADVQSQRNDGQVKLEYDISNETLSVDPGRADDPPYEMRATSGKDECMSDPSCADKPWKGPIPPGDYTIDTNKIDDANFFRDVGREIFKGDFGDYRVGLEPVDGTETHGRDNFMLHGGIFEGSAGCIDVGGGMLGLGNAGKLQQDMRGDADGTIEVKVVAGEKGD